MRARILDLDGAIMLQPEMMDACARSGGIRTAASDLAPRLRLQADRGALADLDARLGPHRAGDIHFIGSGDFHHLALLLVERAGRPLSVVHFDNHPDWTAWPSSLNCGSWVARALEQPNVLRVVTLGPDSSDLAAPQTKGAALRYLREGRLELHPFASSRTFYAGRGFAVPGATAAPGLNGDGLAWHGLEEGDWHMRISEIAARLPDAPIWISLDKDVLTETEALTNWDQGRLSLAETLEAISIFARHRPVIGMDVCGDFSPAHNLGPWRRLLAHLDRAQRPDQTAADTRINGETNLRILRHMEAILS